MEKQSNQLVKIEMLKAESGYGLRRGEIIELEIIEQKIRTTIFLDPPVRRLELYNEDWKTLD